MPCRKKSDVIPHRSSDAAELFRMSVSLALVAGEESTELSPPSIKCEPEESALMEAPTRCCFAACASARSGASPRGESVRASCQMERERSTTRQTGCQFILRLLPMGRPYRQSWVALGRLAQWALAGRLCPASGLYVTAPGQHVKCRAPGTRYDEIPHSIAMACTASPR